VTHGRHQATDEARDNPVEQLTLNPYRKTDRLNDLPAACDGGIGGIPMSAILTSASTHDSQVAIPLAKMSDVMDAAYDAPQIHEISRQFGHVPLIDINPRRNQALKEEITAEHKRCRWVGHKIAAAMRYNGGWCTRTRKGHVPFNVWCAGVNRESDADIRHINRTERF